jgi:hypothetical protein
MKEQRILISVLIVGLLLTLTMGMIQAQGSDPEHDTSAGGVEDGQPNAFLSGEVLTPEAPGEDLSPPDLPALPAGLDQIEEVKNGLSSLRVAGSAMRPRDSDVEWGHGPHPNEGCTFAISGVPARCWTTPLYLPQGATVKHLRMYFNDTSSANSEGWFTVYDLYGVVVEEWDVQSSGSSGTSFRQTGEFTHTINYDSYSYVLKWRPNDTGTDMQLCGFRIYYYPPTSGATFLPIVQNDD